MYITIDTPKEIRRKYNYGDIFLNSAQCLECGEILVSKNRHDFVKCSCDNQVHVDGGSWYLKRGGMDLSKIKELSVLFNDANKDEK